MLERQKSALYQQEMLLENVKITLYQQDMPHQQDMLIERQKSALYQQDILLPSLIIDDHIWTEYESLSAKQTCKL